MTTQHLADRIEAGEAPFVLDVRSDAEYRAGHVPGAMLIPFWQVPARAREIPVSSDAEIVVYCGHGPRAWMAGAVLRARGFTNVHYLEGHWNRWHHDGFPIERLADE